MNPIRRRGRNCYVAALMFVALAGACSGTEPETTLAESTEVAPESTATPVSEPSSLGDETVTLVIDSWRFDDKDAWDDEIIPVFEANHPGIRIEFAPSPPADYDAELLRRLELGIAGDVIACRPFDQSLKLDDRGFLVTPPPSITSDVFSEMALSAWSSDGGVPFCVPAASVLHGFMYNVDIFSELGLEVPATEAEFFAVLEAIDRDGSYVPLAMGLAESWQPATVGVQNIGPSYWKGEEGRTALVEGTGRFTDPEYAAVFATLRRWVDYLPEDAESLSYDESRQLFADGAAAIYPTGSWEVAAIADVVSFEVSAFAPPDAGSGCYVSDHVDLGFGMNASTSHPDETLAFLRWVATPEFASTYANALPGFFPLHPGATELRDPVAQRFETFRDDCSTTIRNSAQILSRGEPNLESEIWRVTVAVLNGSLTPQQAGAELQAGLDSWYDPAG